MSRLQGGVAAVTLGVAFWGCTTVYAGNSAETENTIAVAGELNASRPCKSHHGNLTILADSSQAQSTRRD